MRREDNPLLFEALAYADKGWHIIPLHSYTEGKCTCDKADCPSPAKHPLTPNGVHDATADHRLIVQWWKETDGLANIGIATGKRSGLVVVDVDAKHGGMETLAGLEQTHGALPPTLSASTGGGGRHFYFRYPEGISVGNRAGVYQGIDVRGDDGYVVAPPSLHASGNRYAWAVPPATRVAELPDWLLDMLTGKQGVATAEQMPMPTATTLTVQRPSDDLASHPGADEGQRNATLCRLVGIQLARGEDAEAIMPLALAWAERCSPPVPRAEVERAVESLAQKHQRSTLFVRSQQDAESEFEAMPLPEPTPMPTLGEAAYYGLAGEIVRHIEPETEADPVAMLMSLLVVFGSIIGRRPFFPVEGDKHHVNLFAVLVGESARGRKGTSLGRMRSLIDAVDPAWTKNCTTTGLSSGEGLIWAVRDRVEELERVKEKGKVVGYEPVVRDHGVEDKRLLVTEPEFAQALKAMRREGNTLSPIIRSAWDGAILKALTKNNQAQATDAHVSILGHITQPELMQYMSDSDLFNGFANRFLWAIVKRSKILPNGGRSLDLEPLQKRLVAAHKAASVVQAMKRSPDADVLWDKVYRELTAERSGLYGATTARSEAHTLRLSMLYALLDGSSVIEVPHLQAAATVWEYCDASAKIIFSKSDAESGSPLELLLLETIRKKPGISRKDLHKATGGHLPAVQMFQALVHIRQRGLVRCEKMPTAGRPSERWYPCERTNEAIAPGQVEGLLFVRPDGPVEAKRVVDEPKAGADADAQAEAKAVAGTSSPSTPAADTASAGASPPAVPTTDPQRLAQLIQRINEIGGRLMPSDGMFAVDAPADAITPELEELATACGVKLPQKPLQGKAKDALPPENASAAEVDFLAELRKVGTEEDRWF